MWRLVIAILISISLLSLSGCEGKLRNCKCQTHGELCEDPFTVEGICAQETFTGSATIARMLCEKEIKRIGCEPDAFCDSCTCVMTDAECSSDPARR